MLTNTMFKVVTLIIPTYYCIFEDCNITSGAQCNAWPNILTTTLFKSCSKLNIKHRYA